MKAAVWVDYGKVEVRDVPVPHAGPEDVLVKVKAASLCTTDLTMIKTGILGIKPPVIIGHEVAGVIAEIGNRVQGCRIGDRVTLNPPVPCRRCKICLKGFEHLCRNTRHIGAHTEGGFAEFVVIDYRNAYQIPESVSFQEAALTEPVAVCLEGIAQAGDVKNKDIVVVGDGPFGLIFSRLAQIYKAGHVILIGHHDQRLARAGAYGITTLNSHRDDYLQSILDQTEGYGADVVIDTTASATVIQNSLKILGERGTLVLFGHYEGDVFLNAGLILVRELKVIGSARSLNMFPTALALMKKKDFKVGELITHCFRLEEIDRAIKTIEEEKSQSVKVIIEF